MWYELLFRMQQCCLYRLKAFTDDEFLAENFNICEITWNAFEVPLRAQKLEFCVGLLDFIEHFKNYIKHEHWKYFFSSWFAFKN